MLWTAGKSYEVSSEGQGGGWEAAYGASAPLDARLEPGESVESVQVFDLPKDVLAPGLVLSHGFTPGYFADWRVARLPQADLDADHAVPGFCSTPVGWLEEEDELPGASVRVLMWMLASVSGMVPSLAWTWVGLP